MNKTLPIIISIGDPAGIGTEITLKALGSLELPDNINIMLVGCQKNIELTYKDLKSKGNRVIDNLSQIEIFDIPYKEEINPPNDIEDLGR